MRGSLTPMTISLIPILINRVVLSLRKTVDVDNTVNRAWNTGRFSNMRWEPAQAPATSEGTVGQLPIEGLLGTNDHNDISLDDLTRHERSRSSARTLGVAP